MSRRTPPAAEKQLEKAAEQIQSQLKAAIHTTELDALAAYFTLTEPVVRGVPFCVALARSTFMFHLQMERVAEADTELYAVLIAKVCGLVTSARHPFYDIVLRHDLFGIASGSPNAHCVVLLPVQQYTAIAHLASELVIRECLPNGIGAAWRMKMEQYALSRSPLVSLRAQMLLVKTSIYNDNAQDLAELQRVIQSRPTRMNVDLLLLCYERLQRLVPDPVEGNGHGRALSILSSDIFLKLRSPIRRHYVEHYLYPSLASSDTAHFLDNESTRRHMSSLLLRQCTPGMQPGTPYYMCLCAIVQRDLVEELSGAMELVSLMEYQMPQAAYFISALSVDPHMAQSVFIKMLMLLNRGAAHVMAQRDASMDPVASVVNNRTTMVYNILFTLREIARQCVTTDTKRSAELLTELRTAISPATVHALGTFSSQAFEGRCDISIEPELLCAELGMLLHSTGVDDAMDACIDYFRNAASLCAQCGCPKGSSLVCHTSGAIHLNDRAALSRVLSTVSDCAGSKVVQDKLVSLLRMSDTQLLSATHFLLFHIITHAGQHRNQLLLNLEPHIRSLLVHVADADAMNTVPSDLRASVLYLHARLVNVFPQDPLQLQSMLKIVSGLSIRCEHDALALFWVGHRLLRAGKANVELLAIDPQETHYGQDVPGTAPTSYAAADNAQLLLHILSSAHSFNGATRKLLGCSVCKLIQDFNIQTPNIVSSLMDPLGLIPSTHAAAATFGFPCTPESSFWHFVIRQMKRSAPARTAFVTALTRCVSARFRVESPINAVTVRHADPSSHLFAIGFLACTRRNAQMARIVSFMLAGWLSMRGHRPGKFACILYVCCQLAHVLSQRSGDEVAPTAAEQALLDESVDECVAAVRRAIPEAQQLVQVVPDNLDFQHLLSRIVCSAQFVAGDGQGAPVDDGLSLLPADDHVFSDGVGAAFTEESVALSLAHEGPPVGVGEITQEEDDGLFDNDGPDDDDGGRSGYASAERLSIPRGHISSQQSSLTHSSGLTKTASTATVGTLDTLMSSGAGTQLGQTISGTVPSFVRDGHTVVRDALVMDVKAPVDMPFPGQTRDGASQTSPTDLRHVAGSEELAAGNATLKLPQLQAHSRGGEASFAVPSDVVFDYLMAHQSRVSTLEDLRQLQFADAYGPQSRAEIPATDTGGALYVAVGVGAPNGYSEPHGDQRGGDASSTFVAHLISSVDATPHGQGPRGGAHKRGRDDVTPHQTVASPFVWSQGIDSARNELRSVMADLGMDAGPSSSAGSQIQPPPNGPRFMYPRSFEHHQQLSSMAPHSAAESVVPLAHGGAGSHQASFSQSQPFHSESPALPMGLRAGGIPLAHGFVEQHCETALREVRQAMGTANPNTAHTMGGRARKEPLGSNATYNIGSRQGHADYYSLL